MEPQHRADFRLPFVVGDCFLVESRRQHGQSHAVEAGGGLDDVRKIDALEKLFDEGGDFLAGGFGFAPILIKLVDERAFLPVVQPVTRRLEFLVEHLEGLAGELLVLREVEIAARRDALEFLRAEGELEEDVHRGPGVVGQFLGFLPVVVEHVGPQADGGVVFGPLVHPIPMPHFPSPVGAGLAEVGPLAPAGHVAVDEADGLVGLDEELELHLLELARPEGVVARRDLIAESLADLPDAERHSHAGRVEDVLELNEDGLRRLRS